MSIAAVDEKHFSEKTEHERSYMRRFFFFCTFMPDRLCGFAENSKNGSHWDNLKSVASEEGVVQ